MAVPEAPSPAAFGFFARVFGMMTLRVAGSGSNTSWVFFWSRSSFTARKTACMSEHQDAALDTVDQGGGAALFGLVVVIGRARY